MLRCKPGDLAIVVYAPIAEDNLGLLVNVIESVPELHTECRHAWKVEVVSKRPVLGMNSLNGKMTNTGADDSAFAVAYDDDLRPIRPGEEIDEVKRELAFCS